MFNWIFKGKEKQNFDLKVGEEVVPPSWILNQMKYYFEKNLFREIPSAYLNKYSYFPEQNKDRQFYDKILTQEGKFSPSSLNLQGHELRAIGCMVGLGIGDALGASTQFEPFDKHRKYWIQNGFGDLEKRIQERVLHERHGEIGIWTDDCSMANSMAYSLMINKYEFNPVHIRYMFQLWLHHGLGNGGRSSSIGLGGNISISTCQFKGKQEPYTAIHKKFNSGNGSLMRLAPVPIAYRFSEKDAIQKSSLQSRTTHDGDEAQECCRLLALLLVRLMNRETDDWRSVLDAALNEFTSEKKSVECLAKSKKENQEIYADGERSYGKIFTSNNPTLNDRDWNWRNPDFTYSQFRAKRQPGYIGSYCMDALSMALHIIWQKNSFKDCILWSINMGGDCDTVGAIVGQLSGAIYGYNEQMHQLYKGMQDFKSKRFEIFLIGAELAKKRE